MASTTTRLLAGLLMGLLCCGAAAQDDEEQLLPYIYGRLDLSLNRTAQAMQSYDTSSHSNASRLGLQNIYALTDDLRLFYRLEYGADIDAREPGADSDSLRPRDSYIGLQGTWGQTFLGVHSSPLKAAELGVDLFNNRYLADMDSVLAGQNRPDTTLSYVTPDMGGLTAWIMLAANADSIHGGTSLGKPAATAGHDGETGVSASLVYAWQPVRLAAALSHAIAGLDLLRLTAQLRAGAWQAGAMLQAARNTHGAADAGLGYLLSLGYAVDSYSTVKLEYVSAGHSVAATSPGSELISVGYDYQLRPAIQLYGYYSKRVNVMRDAAFATTGIGIRYIYGDNGCNAEGGAPGMSCAQ